MSRVSRWLLEVTAGAPVYPLVVLFGLNAVDELDRTAFGILLPEIRDAFGLDVQGVLTVVALAAFVALLLQVPIAHYADRGNRVRLAALGALAWAIFSLLTGLATGVVMLALVRSGSGLGKAVVDPTHNSLLADYYDVGARARVYSFHRAANAVGSFVGPLTAGLLAYSFGWRTPFYIFTIPTLIFVLMALRLREPLRGGFERRATGADETTVNTAEPSVSLAEAWRVLWKVESLRRIWYSLPFLAGSLIGFVSLSGLLYEKAFHLDERARGFIAAAVEPAQLIGLTIGARIGTRWLLRDPGKVLRLLARVSVLVSAALVVFIVSPTIPVTIVANIFISALLALLGPGILASLSLAIPSHVRSVGFSIGSLWVLPGLFVLPFIGWIGDHWGIRQGMMVMVPVYLIGGLVIATAGRVIGRDIQQVWTAAAARAEVQYDRRAGRMPLLRVRSLDVAYSGTKVLFGVDLDLDEGEIVALLGTNGAGKSTLLKAILGIVEADHGAVIFDGRDITHTPTYEIAALGIASVAGGAGVFPSLTVAENLAVAGWLDHESQTERRARAIELFPMLADHLDRLAGDLSGGQQQMLALGMALVARPRLLLVDELSLGLAPVIVEQLLGVVRRIADAGTTVILVEQSVTTALHVARTAYFMEKGEIRFHGNTAELLERPDVLRSVFLGEIAGAVDARPVIERADVSSALAVREITVSFGGVRALDGASWTLGKGEILGVIGANGAGKTTLFDVISGFLAPDAGTVLFDGVDITSWSPQRRGRAGLGRSFQDARLFPALTVQDAITVALQRWIAVREPIAAAFHLPAARVSEAAASAHVDQLLDMFKLGDFRSKFVRELSTGSRRVVDLACVVAHRPSVLLLDEPSSGIAQRETEALVPLIRRVRDEFGTAIAVVEHDMTVVSAVCERVVAMDQGRVIADGAPSAVLSDAGVVASYLGNLDHNAVRSAPKET